MQAKQTETKTEQEMLETKVELNKQAKKDKSFTDIIKENFRKFSAVYFAAAAIGIGGLAGCGRTIPHVVETNNYTSPFQYTQNSQVVVLSSLKSRLDEILKYDCVKLLVSKEEITCINYYNVCVLNSSKVGTGNCHDELRNPSCIGRYCNDSTIRVCDEVAVDICLKTEQKSKVLFTIDKDSCPQIQAKIERYSNGGYPLAELVFTSFDGTEKSSGHLLNSEESRELVDMLTMYCHASKLVN